VILYRGSSGCWLCVSGYQAPLARLRDPTTLWQACGFMIGETLSTEVEAVDDGRLFQDGKRMSSWRSFPKIPKELELLECSGTFPLGRVREPETMTPLFRKILGMNWVLVLTMYGLLIFGIFAIESAARHLPGQDGMSGGEFFASRHKMWMGLGTIVYFFSALIDYRWVRWLGVPMYVIGLALTVKAMGVDDGVHRLDFGRISFQPAQLAIAAGIIAIATLAQDLPKIHRFFTEPSFRVLLIAALTGIPFLLVVKLGDMGSALVWVPVAIVAILVSGIPWRYLILLTGIAVGMTPIAYFIALPSVSERGTERIEMYLESVDSGIVEKTDKNWAPYWVSTAVGKAGWKGLGWGATDERGSLHDKKYIPWKTAHNDYIFAVIAEEQGFRGALLLVTAFALLLIQCLFIAFYSRDLAGRIIVGGVVGLFFAHMFENIGMCVLLTPITGIPLPLVSYSGTFVVICMFLLGLVQSVWVHRSKYIEVEA
jgi:rod shape determining protein RodA